MVREPADDPQPLGSVLDQVRGGFADRQTRQDEQVGDQAGAQQEECEGEDAPGRGEDQPAEGEQPGGACEPEAQEDPTFTDVQVHGGDHFVDHEGVVEHQPGRERGRSGEEEPGPRERLRGGKAGDEACGRRCAPEHQAQHREHAGQRMHIVDNGDIARRRAEVHALRERAGINDREDGGTGEHRERRGQLRACSRFPHRGHRPAAGPAGMRRFRGIGNDHSRRAQLPQRCRGREPPPSFTAC